MSESDYAKSRKAAFRADHPLPIALMEVAKTDESHAFLANPTAVLCYVYLIDYIKKLTGTLYPDKHRLRILDWGCGKGQISYLLKQAFPEASVVSCDVSGDLANIDSTFGQKTPLVKAFNIDIVSLTHPVELPFADASFDLVLSIGVLEHVHNDQASLHEIHRILAPDGLFACAFLPYTHSWTQKLAHLMGDGYHDRLYNWEIVDKLLAESRLKRIDSWHRALLPKNPVHFPFTRAFESMDQWLCEHTPLRHLATNIEFIAQKT